MAVSFDSYTMTSQFSSVSPFSFTHNPVGSPSGIVVGIGQILDATDIISSVSYSGITVSRITAAFDPTAAEGGSYIYHLGTGIPTGAQVVNIFHTGSATSKVAVCISVLADRDTYNSASSRTFENRANPTVLLDSGSTEGMGFCAFYTGSNNVVTTPQILASSMTTGDQLDFGTEGWRWDRETSPASSSRSMGYTMASDGVALVAMVVSEVAAVASVTTTPVKRPLRIPQAPPTQSGITGLVEWARLVAKQLNGEGYISLFSGTNPNTSGVTGIPGDMLINIGSDSTSTRLWVKKGGITSVSTISWVMVRIA